MALSKKEKLSRRAAYMREYGQRPSAKEQRRKYCQREDVKEKARVSARQWSAKNREKKAATTRAWELNNPERHLAGKLAWISNNKEKHRMYQRLYQSARRDKVKSVSVGEIDIDALLERANGSCEICGGSLNGADYHIDHIIPIAKDGLHEQANLQVAHPFCNRSKGAKMPSGFA